MPTEIISLLDLTRAMLVSVEADDWERVAEQEQQRQQLMYGIDFTALLQGDAVNEVRMVMQEVLAMNDKMVETGMRTRETLTQSVGAIQQGRKAQRAYLDEG